MLNLLLSYLNISILLLKEIFLTIYIELRIYLRIKFYKNKFIKWKVYLEIIEIKSLKLQE